MKKLTVKEVLERNINKYVFIDFWGNLSKCGLSNNMLEELDDFTLNYRINENDVDEYSNSDTYDVILVLD